MVRLVTLLLLAAAVASGQTPAPPPPEAAQIVRQFGPAFHADPAFPVLVADFDGDGAEDAVAVATNENPLLDELEFHYKVADPYGAAFGFKDPKLMRRFSTEEKPRLLLVVLNWRAPKAKFVLMSVPFEKLSLTRVLVKKRPVPAVLITEDTGMKSTMFWDGKKWKWKEEQ
jgi:hypothetical protein